MKKYPKMKDSGIEWIGDIPEKWNQKRLKYSVFLRSDKLRDLDSRSYVGLENIEPQTGKLIDVNDEMEESDAKLFEENDVLLGKLRPYLAKVWLANFNGKCSSEFLVFKGIDYDSKYLSLLLLSDGSIKTIDSSTYGAKMPRAEWGFISNMLFPIPPLVEQKSISKLLDKEISKVNSEISKNQKLIELLKEKKLITIHQAVTKGLDPTTPMINSKILWIGEIPKHWEFKKIKWDTKVMRGASPRPIDDEKYFDDCGKYGWVRISDVTQSNGILKKTEQKLSELGANLSVKLEVGELFLSIAGSVGKQCITQILCCIHDGFVYFPRLNLLKKYLYYIFEADECYKGLGKLGTQLNLNTDTVGNITVPFPPKKEQMQIIEYLDSETSKIDLLISKIELQIENLQESRQSLISSTVTGKIDVREAVA